MKKTNIIPICNGNERGAYNWKRYLNHGYKYNKNKTIAMSKREYNWEDETLNSYISFSYDNAIPIEKIIDYLDENFYIWTLGYFIQNTASLNNNISFHQNSVSIGLLNTPFEKLIKITEKICNEFNFTNALVKDCSTKKIVLIITDKGDKICLATHQF